MSNQEALRTERVRSLNRLHHLIGDVNKYMVHGQTLSETEILNMSLREVRDSIQSNSMYALYV